MYKDIRQNGKSIVKVMKNGYIIWQKPNPGILPEGYVECEYLESHGTEYIDTGAVITYNTKTEVRYQWVPPYVGSWHAIFGAMGNANNDGEMFILSQATNNRGTRFAYGPTGYVRLIYVDYGNYDDFNIHTFYASQNEYKYDGVLVSVGDDHHLPNFSSIETLSLFCNHRSTRGYIEYGVGRIYYCKIDNGETGVSVNLIPCLDDLGVPCMYDTISGASFYNQGTGTFGYKIKDPELEYAGYGTLYKLPLGTTYIKDFGWIRGHYHDLHANVVGSGTSSDLTGLSNPILIEPGYTYTVVRPSPSSAESQYNAWFTAPAPGLPGETAKNHKLICGGDPMSQKMSQPSDARYLYVSFKCYNQAAFDKNYNEIYITKSRTV